LDGVVNGKPIALDRTPVTYQIDRTSAVWPREEDWYRFIDAMQGDPAQYLYAAVAVPMELAAAVG
jgi:hypothetical protein